jgi:hypothetical protein
MDRQQATVAAIIEAAKSNFFFSDLFKIQGLGTSLAVYSVRPSQCVQKCVKIIDLGRLKTK